METSQGANPNTAADSGAFGVGFTQVERTVEGVMETRKGRKRCVKTLSGLLIGLWWNRV